MDRRYLVAKRRYDEKNSDQQQNATRNNTRSSNVQQNRHGIKKAVSSKNIADARMKRLRESLANDLNESDYIGSTPPAKRFAPDSETRTSECCNIPELESNSPLHLSHTLAPYSSQLPATPGIEQKAVSCKSPRKNFTPYSNFSPPSTSRQSANKRLKDAITSTPQHIKHKKYSKAATSLDDHLTFTQFVQNNTASTSGAELLNDEDSVITDLSASSNNFSNLSTSSISNVSLLCHANNSTREDIDIENMDWSPISEEQLLSNIREARESLFSVQNQQQLALNKNKDFSVGHLNTENLFVVVDTNIFIDKLQTVINIMHISYADDSQPVIYVPWMVIQELDYFKDGYSLSEKHPVSKIIQTRCRKAVKFINECLIAGKQNFKGQPVQRAAETRLKGHSADDSILSCCVQLFSEGFDVILLSSDTNLRNKAMISNIRAFAPIEIMNELKKKSLKKTFNFVDEISKKLALICSFVLHFEIKAHYGERHYEQQLFKDLPWQFRDCIKYMREHFDPVFRSHLPKQCRKVVDDLHEFLFVNEAIVNEIKFTELCLSLLIYLQTGLPKYETNIHNTIQEIKELEREFFV